MIAFTRNSSARRAMLPVKTILIPTDFSEQSAAAFHLASALARDYNAELVIAHISPIPVPAVADGMVIELPTGWREEAEARLKIVKPTDLTIRYSHKFAVGDEMNEIVELAGELKADLIVMGTHGRSGLSRLLMGSVAEYVMRHAPCPVLTVRHPFAIPPTASTNTATAVA
jgi:nucleotide-binding universal stress UspA family protein